MSTEAQAPTLAAVSVVHNGRVLDLRYRPSEPVDGLLAQAIHRFRVQSEHHELALFTIRGAELPGGQTLAEAGVAPGAEFVLRRHVARGERWM